jgi:hypothetical protein
MRTRATEGVLVLVTNIWVLGSANLPILAALWATKTFIPERQTAEIKFVKRFPLLKDVKPNDLFVGTEDTLTKAEKATMNGRMLETFPAILKKYGTEADKQALADLSRFVSLMHPLKTMGQLLSPNGKKELQSVISHTGIDAVLCALKFLYPHGGDVHFSRMSELFEGMLKSGKSRIQIKEAAERTELIHEGRIAITSRAANSPVHGALFHDHGVKVIIFNDGYNLGILRHPSVKIKLDDVTIMALIDAAHERSEWHITPAGGLFQRGTSENRRFEHSRVNKIRLADALASLMDASAPKVRELESAEA